jgi:2-polyprenyl-3-methyl-5-hydroxy-6-metoxy-1,4-benzoquinol methylase
MMRCGAENCGALWLDPAPHPDDLSEAYAEYYTHSLSSDDPAGFRATVRDAFAARVLGYDTPYTIGTRLASWLYFTSPRRSEWALYKRFHLPGMPGGRLLEIGCGSGAQLALMARLGWEAAGLDFDPDAVATARSRGLRVSAGDVREMGYPAESFDAIVMTHVIEHVVDPVGLLRECRRILKPNGTLVLVTPNPASLGHRLYGRAWRGLEPPRHLVVFAPAALRLACSKAGFEVLSVQFSARDAANLFLSSERLRDTAPGQRIRLPESSVPPPLGLRLLENLERIACWLKRPWGEEQILIGRPQGGAPEVD